jgi:hypothetical protein
MNFQYFLYSRTITDDYNWIVSPEKEILAEVEAVIIKCFNYSLKNFDRFLEIKYFPLFFFERNNFIFFCVFRNTGEKDQFFREIYSIDGIYIDKKYKNIFWSYIPYFISKYEELINDRNILVNPNIKWSFMKIISDKPDFLLGIDIDNYLLPKKSIFNYSKFYNCNLTNDSIKEFLSILKSGESRFGYFSIGYNESLNGSFDSIDYKFYQSKTETSHKNTDDKKNKINISSEDKLRLKTKKNKKLSRNSFFEKIIFFFKNL